MQTMKDQIKHSIMEKMVLDKRVNLSGITVEVNERRVRLKGNVSEHQARVIAEHHASSVSGVAGVDNLIRVGPHPDVQAPSDRQIAKKVTTLLKTVAGIDPHRVKVCVEDGLLTIEGSVRELELKKLAEDLAEIRGVLDVRNKLAVVPTEDFSDRLIAREIVDLIDRCACANVNTVHVRVEDRIVTLSGVVPDLATYFSIYNYAVIVGGVADVRNDIVMWPSCNPGDR